MYMYVYVCICMHLYVYVCICMYLYVYVCICMYVYVYVCICMYMYVYVCICLYMSVYVCICMYMYLNVCICMYMYAYVCICMYMYVYVCICMYMYVYVCICLYMYVSVCICMYIMSVYVCICMYVCMHGSLLEDYPRYKRGEHHGMFVSEHGWISRWILHWTNPNGCFFAWGKPKTWHRKIHMAHHGTQTLESCWCWYHGNGWWARQRRMKPSNRSPRYIYFHRSGQRHVEIFLDSWNLLVFHGFITYHITPHHIKSHQISYCFNFLHHLFPRYPRWVFPSKMHGKK